MGDEELAAWLGMLDRGHRHRGEKQHSVSKEWGAGRTRQRGEAEKNLDMILWREPIKGF